MPTMTDAEKMRAVAEHEVMLLRDLEAARAEIKELRQAVVAMCDTYSANRSEKLRVKAYRAVAAKALGPFSLAAVEDWLAQLEDRERDDLEAAERVITDAAEHCAFNTETSRKRLEDSIRAWELRKERSRR